ncbi:hypothetical protein AY601_4915 [Pedobacter cryoconitis]|uniref:TonB C-terminal domain-containing protein n=1 Tax=Pedobacter cryoconitis TaxID=188932 RepID=A0A127VK91_9SPHI|nr:energy transducer TonB [Pedobacter cryoconitis]AMQ01735.1 hypothetical protein AY601_4915 [Pedobacter cryoconitis]
MYRFNFLFFGLCCVFLTASAQRRNTYFIKNNGARVTERDSADFIRHVIEPDPGSEFYKVKEYYLDGTVKSTGFSSKIYPPLYEGLRTTFYPNGNLEETAHFIKGHEIDTATSYYPDGKLYSVRVYSITPEQAKQLLWVAPDEKILTVKDMTGKDLTVNGNGEYIAYDNDFKEILERGQLKEGLHEGVWTGKTKDSSANYTETYVHGKLISGESINAQHITYKYTEAYIQPVFKGGMKRFYSYLASHIKYPPSCYKAGIQGVAQMKFTIERDGTLTDIKVLNAIHPDIAAEATRVMRASPKWEPGKMRGEPVRVAYNIPLSFHL